MFSKILQLTPSLQENLVLCVKIALIWLQYLKKKLNCTQNHKLQ